MTRTHVRERLSAINSGLLAVLFFLIPTEIAPAYVLSAVMLLLWAVEGRWSAKWQLLRSNRVFWIFQAFFWWHVVSMAWTDNWVEGRHMLSRHAFFLLSGLYFTVARREHTARYIGAFAFGVFLCELLAGYNWLQLNQFPHWPAGLRAAKDALETAPFVDRIFFGPIVAFAAYVAALKAVEARGRARWTWALALVASIAELSISGSRTGLVAFCLVMALLTLQVLSKRRWLALASALVVLAVTAGGIYVLGDRFTRDRITVGFDESGQLESGVNKSVPMRHNMAVNTLHIIAEQPWLGVGAGDFVAAYKEMNARRTPGWDETRNPHDQLLFTLATTGIFGAALLLAAWFAPLWIHRHRRDGLDRLGVGLVVFYFTICLAESYLWRTNTGLMFALFSALLYGPAPLGVAGSAPGIEPASQSR